MVLLIKLIMHLLKFQLIKHIRKSFVLHTCESRETVLMKNPYQDVDTRC